MACPEFTDALGEGLAVVEAEVKNPLSGLEDGLEGLGGGSTLTQNENSMKPLLGSPPSINRNGRASDLRCSISAQERN